MQRRILGIDPGSRITGFGLIGSAHQGRASQSPEIITSGHWVLGKDDMGERLANLYAAIQDCIQEFLPTEVVIERAFVHKNAQSALKLGQARGVVIAAAVAHGLPIFEYAPREIKQAIVGTGAGLKDQVQQMVKILLRLSALPQADEADALAAAICHLHTNRYT